MQGGLVKFMRCGDTRGDGEWTGAETRQHVTACLCPHCNCILELELGSSKVHRFTIAHDSTLKKRYLPLSDCLGII